MSDERGFTLIEVLVSMVVMVFVLGAALTTFTGFERNVRQSSQRDDAQESARRAINRLARDMRNSVSAGAPIAESVERATATDLIFQTTGATGATAGNPTARMRVRYCLNTTTDSNNKLFRQVDTWTGAATAMPTATTCPGTGYDQTQPIADRLTNAYGGVTRTLFTYRFTPATSTSTAELVAVMPTAYVDVTPGPKPPAEVTLRSGVYLRNANQAPAASFTHLSQGGKVILNATASADPEGQSLSYDWYLDGSTTILWKGVRVEKTLSGCHSIRLVVTDPAGATDETTASNVCVS